MLSSQCECVLSQLDLFQTLPTQVSIDQTQTIEVKPISSITDSNVIEFNVSASPDHYINLAECYLYLKARVIKSDGTALNDAQSRKVAPINLWHSGLFQQVELIVNNTTVCTVNGYPYRAYIENLLNYSEDTKRGWLASALWQDDDDLSKQDEPDGSKRGTFIKESKPVDMLGRVHVDLFNQDKLLLSNNEVKLRFVRSKDEFSLLCALENADQWQPKIQIMEASLLVTRMRVSPTVQLAHARALETATAKYHYRKAEVKTFAIQAGALSSNIDTAYLGTLPSTLVLGLVDHDAYNGTFKKSPFNFKHLDLNFLQLYVNGTQVPSKPLCPDFSNDQYIQAYFTLFSGTGRALSNDSFGITRQNYSQGHTLYAFDLTSDEQGEQRDHLNLSQHGSLKIELKFKNPLPNVVNLIAYAEFEACMQIDRHRNIMVE